MNLKEYASLNEITLADAKKRTGLTHWNQTIVDEPIIEAPEPEVVAKAPESVIDTVSQEDKIKSVRGLGTKSPYWSELNG